MEHTEHKTEFLQTFLRTLKNLSGAVSFSVDHSARSVTIEHSLPTRAITLRELLIQGSNANHSNFMSMNKNCVLKVWRFILENCASVSLVTERICITESSDNLQRGRAVNLIQAPHHSLNIPSDDTFYMQINGVSDLLLESLSRFNFKIATLDSYCTIKVNNEVFEGYKVNLQRLKAIGFTDNFKKKVSNEGFEPQGTVHSKQSDWPSHFLQTGS